MALDPQRRRLAAALDGGRVAVFDLKPGARGTTVGQHESAAFVVAFSAADGTLASAGREGEVKVSSGPGESRTLGRHEGDVFGLAFSPDGRRLASASADKTVRVWDPSGNAAPKILRTHQDQVSSVTFTDDGRLVSGGFDGVRISDWQRGVTLLTIPGAVSMSMLPGVRRRSCSTGRTMSCA